MSTVRLTVRDIPEYVHARLKEIATSEDRSINWVIVRAIEAYVAKPVAPSKRRSRK